MTPMKTWRRQTKQTKREPTNIETWINPRGTHNRKIEYIMVNQKYRNCARKAYVIQEWRRNQEQRQQAAVELEIFLLVTKQYYAKHGKKLVLK